MNADPFESLRDDGAPVSPRPEFASQLRRLIEAELRPPTASVGRPQGPVGTALGGPSWLYYFTLPTRDLARAKRFYGHLFGWTFEDNPDGTGTHVADVQPPMGIGTDLGAHPMLWFVVADVEAVVERIGELGGRADPPVDHESGRAADCFDDQGVAFSVTVPTYDTAPVPSSRPGELFYFSIPAADRSRSERFFGELFGWEFDAPGAAGGAHVANVQPDGGLSPGPELHPSLWFRVADLDDAMATVVVLGGSAEPAGEGPEGRHAVCTDDQGVRFGISQPT